MVVVDNPSEMPWRVYSSYSDHAAVRAILGGLCAHGAGPVHVDGTKGAVRQDSKLPDGRSLG